MATINDIIIQASELQPGISRLLRNSTYPRYDDLSGLEINYEDGEQLFLLDHGEAGGCGGLHPLYRPAGSEDRAAAEKHFGPV